MSDSQSSWAGPQLAKTRGFSFYQEVRWEVVRSLFLYDTISKHGGSFEHWFTETMVPLPTSRSDHLQRRQQTDQVHYLGERNFQRTSAHARFNESWQRFHDRNGSNERAVPAFSFEPGSDGFGARWGVLCGMRRRRC